MIRAFLTLVLALVATPIASTAAQAATAIYTIAGTGSGSLGGTAFNNVAFSFTLTGDTANLSQGDLGPLTSAVASIAGFGPVTFTQPTRIGYNAGTGLVFFGRDLSNDYFNFSVAAPVNLGASFGPVTGSNILALNQFTNIATSGGALTFTSSSSVQFSGVIGAAVPEPATWAMFIGGLGLVGGSMRRRPTKVSFATA